MKKDEAQKSAKGKSTRESIKEALDVVKKYRELKNIYSPGNNQLPNKFRSNQFYNQNQRNRNRSGI